MSSSGERDFKKYGDYAETAAKTLKDQLVFGSSLLRLTKEELLKEPYKILGGPASDLAQAIEELKAPTEAKQTLKRLLPIPLELGFKKQKIEAHESPFLYGEQNFVSFGEGAFFRDNTRFIAEIENLKTKAIVSLHPRRFGKTLFVNMLNQYYDIKNKGHLREIFGGCWIEKNPTENFASFLVLPLDFSGLLVDNFESFNRFFNEMGNNAIQEFLEYYNLEINWNMNGSFVQNFKSVCRQLVRKGHKIYVTIDEYDSSLMKSLTKQLAMEMKNHDNKESLESERIESQFKNFFSILKQLTSMNVWVFVTGISPLCFTEFTSGWNHETRISDKLDFAELYGFTEEDVKKGLKMIQPPIPEEIQLRLLQYCDCYDGYRFDPDQKNRLFNPGRILYFLSNVRENWLYEGVQQLNGEELFKRLLEFNNDAQTRPAESTLNYIKSSKA